MLVFGSNKVVSLRSVEATALKSHLPAEWMSKRSAMGRA